MLCFKVRNAKKHPVTKPLCVPQHPLVNAGYDPSGGIVYKDDINVCMAVALDGGLITPTLRNCNEKDIYTVGREWKVGS